MEDERLYELLERFESSTLTLLEIEKEEFRVRFERCSAGSSAQSAVKTPRNAAVPDREVSAVQDVKASEAGSAAADVRDNEGRVTVKAPLVGVFYSAPSPAEPPYVEVGQSVREGDVLCLVEAMKMMNELTSPVDGIVSAVCGSNGELVEYGQVLFEVEAC